MKNFLKSALLFIFLLSPSLSSQQLIDGIAAIVGDNVILLSEVNGLVTQYAFQNKIDISQQPEIYRQLGKKFLQNLIDQKLLLIKADEDTIKSDEEKVDQSLKQQLDYLIQQAGSTEKLEEYYSEPLFKIKKDLRKEISNQMRIGMLRERKFGLIKISRREVENFYRTYKDSLPGRKASVDISHILLQVTPSEKSVQEAYRRISEIKKQLENGVDFAELARKYSEDPGSAQNGGDLGFVSRGTFVKDFEEAAFALKKNQISNIVQSQFGFHIIQLLDRQGERIHVRHILIRLQPTKQDEERVVRRLKNIRRKILSGDSTFEEMALKYSADPNVQKDKGHLGMFEEGGFQIKEFARAVSSLKEGEISEPFKTEFGYHIVRLNSRQEARELRLKDDWEQIEQWALQRKREEEFKAWVAQLRKEIPVIIKTDI
ncbi:MAG TPA: parvulin peptidyl-prolyl isomerase [Caldithrix sp.]|nr:parvulin peptidyl-prolyl isomerase [Caldithrix sp.]